MDSMEDNYQDKNSMENQGKNSLEKTSEENSKDEFEESCPGHREGLRGLQFCFKAMKIQPGDYLRRRK